MELSTQVHGFHSKDYRLGDIGEDQISNLPEDIISHILSCLKTKDAVRTCVLSKDWAYKWTSIYNVNISDWLTKFRMFEEFMERVYILLLSHHHVKYFRLSCFRRQDLTSMQKWISAVLKCKVESFYLYYVHDGLVIPHSLLNSTSLRNLELKVPCTLTISGVMSFLNLTRMHLSDVQIFSENSDIDTLVVELPVLKDISLERCKWLNLKSIEIDGTALTTFTYRSLSDSVAGLGDCSIKIIGANLEKFETYGVLKDNIILTRCTVTHAALSGPYIWSYDDFNLFRSQACKLLKQLSSIKFLELKNYNFKGVGRSNLGIPLPWFNNLEQLKVHCGGEVDELLELLHAAPFLKFVELEVLNWKDYDYHAVKAVPSCILCSLEEIRFMYCSNIEPGFCLEKFFLKHGAQLKHVSLSVMYERQKDDLLKKLSACPKASTCLTMAAHMFLNDFSWSG